MALSTTTAKVVLAGNGATTIFPYTFPIPDTASLQVIYTDTAGVQTTLSSSQYSVTGIGGTTGGNVTYAGPGGVAIAVGTKLTIARIVDYTQSTVFTNQGGYYPAVVEARFDRVMMAMQQLVDRVGRALVAPISDGAVSDMPTATQRANTFLGFDASGNPIATLLQTTVLTVSNFIQTNILPAANAAAVRSAIGFGDVNCQPGGRLTLVTGVPVMISSQASKTTIFYTPYNTNLIPIFNGSAFVPTAFAELSNLTTASSVGSAGPAAVTTNKNYDLFVWSNAGTPTLTRGGPWNSDTVRSSTTENDLQRVSGILTNKNTITNGPGAGLGTYVGTVRSDGSSQINWIVGAAAAGGTAAVLGVWNMHNRVDCRGQISDSTDSWSYTSTTVRGANASSTLRVSFVMGQQEDFLDAKYYWRASTTGGGAGAAYVLLNSTNSTAAAVGVGPFNASSNATAQTAGGSAQLLGFNFLQAAEAGDGANATTYYGDNGTVVQSSGLQYQGRF